MTSTFRAMQHPAERYYTDPVEPARSAAPIDMVDAAAFAHLFREDLGWCNPAERSFTLPTEHGDLDVLPVSTNYGFRVWVIRTDADARARRRIFDSLEVFGFERLVIFIGSDGTQHWTARHGRVVSYQPGGDAKRLTGVLDALRCDWGADDGLLLTVHRVRAAFPPIVAQAAA